jgi:hypothetical protein
MVTNIGRLDTQRALKLFADWTDRIAAGALPQAAPQRPQGVERNVVVPRNIAPNTSAGQHHPRTG